MEYFAVILAYFVIGFAISYYLGKRFRAKSLQTGNKYAGASGALVLFWPILLVIAVIALACAIIGFICYLLGRVIYWVDSEPKDNVNETTN